MLRMIAATKKVVLRKTISPRPIQRRYTYSAHVIIIIVFFALLFSLYKHFEPSASKSIPLSTTEIHTEPLLVATSKAITPQNDSKHSDGDVMMTDLRRSTSKSGPQFTKEIRTEPELVSTAKTQLLRDESKPSDKDALHTHLEQGMSKFVPQTMEETPTEIELDATKGSPSKVELKDSDGDTPSKGFYMWQLKSELGRKAPTCRIFNACISHRTTATGTEIEFHLPSKLRNFKEDLENCGISTISFDDPIPTDVETLRTMREFIPVETSTNKPATNTPLINHDLLIKEKFAPLNPHFPHFADQIIPYLNAVDVITGEPRNEMLCQTLVENNTWMICTGREQSQNLQPLLIPVKSNAPNEVPIWARHGWTHKFLAPLREKSNFVFAAYLDMFPDTRMKKSTADSGQKICPRSLITTRRSLNTIKENTLSQNPLFLRPFHPHRNLESTCTLNILLVTRDRERVFKNIDAVQNALEHKINELKSSRVPGLTAQVSRTKFEGQSFEAQVQSMYNADVAVMTHGAGCTNIIFMRVNALFIEILAFGYNGEFRALAMAMKLRYVPLTSAPDLKQLNKCREAVSISEARNYMQTYATGVYTFTNPNLTNSSTRICLKRADVEIDPNTVVGIVFTKGFEGKECQSAVIGS